MRSNWRRYPEYTSSSCTGEAALTFNRGLIWCLLCCMHGSQGNMEVRRLLRFVFGAVNPSGKLPITMEKHAGNNPASATFPTDLNATTINYSEGLFVGYRDTKRIKSNHSILLDT